MIPMTGWSQQAAIKKIIKMAREDNRTMQHLDILCNRFGGRPAGSDACANAEQWVKRNFESWGYDVKLEKAGDLSVGFNRGGWWGKMIGEESMNLHFATNSYSSGTKGPQRGHVVIEPRTQSEFDGMKHRLKGAWVLLYGKSTGRSLLFDEETKVRRQEIIERNNEAEAYNKTLTDKDAKRRGINHKEPALFYDEMIAAGVLGFVQAAPVPIQARYDQTVVKGRIPFDSLPTTPHIMLDEGQFYRIRKLVRQRRDIELEFDIRNYFKIGPVDYHNVVATMKGSKYPDEYVIMGCHLDSYDVATGGVDCGSGVSSMMEAARMLAVSGAKPERTIIFIVFAAEEFGLLGSKAWVKAHPEKIDKISLMINRDGGPLPYVGFEVPKSMIKAYDKIAEPIRELYPDYGFEVSEMTRVPRSRITGGSDYKSFLQVGVPAVKMTMRDIKGYNFQYREIWHTERDTYQKAIPEYQEQAAAALAIIALGTANLPTLLPRDEFFRP